MNERIRQLAEQAGYGSRWNTTEEFEQFLENLVQSTVRECVGIIENVPPCYQDYRDQIEDGFRSFCINQIKRQFGLQAE